MQNIHAFHTMYGVELRETVQVSEHCFYTRAIAYLPSTPPTAEDLADMAAIEQLEQSARDAGLLYDDAPDWAEQGCFTSAKAAERVAALFHVLRCIHEDIEVMHAPGECYSRAVAGPQLELEALCNRAGTRYPQ